MQNHINNQNVQAQAATMEEIERIMALFDALQMLINNVTTNLARFRALPQCTDTLVRLNTCGRCVDVRPLFCENVCGALANACYSPFNDAFKGQLQELWDTMNVMLSFMNASMVKLNTEKGLLDRNAIVSSFSSNCIHAP